MSLRGIYTAQVVTVSEDEPLVDVAALMRTLHVGDVIVTRNQGDRRIPVGIITDRDIAVGVVAKSIDENALVAKDLMSPDVVTVDESESVHHAIRLMREYGFSRLPVVDASGELLGVLSSTDLLNVLTMEMRSLIELNFNRQQHEREDRP